MARKAEAKRDRIERVIRFPGPLYVELRKLADVENRSVNGQVLAAIEEQLAKVEAEGIRESLARGHE